MDTMKESKKDRTSIPQFHAEKCPVCSGFGTLKYGTKVCQGCQGKGYILVPNSDIGNQKEGGENENSR